MKTKQYLNLITALIITVCLIAPVSMACASSGEQATATDVEFNAAEILLRADEARGNLQGVKWRLKIISLEGDVEKIREMRVKSKAYDFLARLVSPPKVKDQKLLTVNHNMWFTKPGLSKPVPISSRQKLIGGAAYGDIAATNYSGDYDATLLKEEMVNGEMCYVFDLYAKTKDVTYDRIKYWVTRERNVGVKAEYYTVSGKLFKWAEFAYDNQVMIDNAPRPFISSMQITDALNPSNLTTLYFTKNKIAQLPDSTFDLNLFSMD